ncbi:Short-chain dehydrogenase/reductase SDR family and Glucose/ribitol dehydrogenase family and NAD(P)-binding domain-containing protein [Strongyloides ratti]|uniref:Short-chain dehydrogenase/reductase SDR family and Glucose/ribitol dehydrogenase family and NAD(P)-binding domain-containing protein n=1 Tax=Strongyloides ratti TaxID=34506 RepID=A0A090L4H6_STRRB|nr:Short-chain dehydrogenase/reductase SDR family and Glucose/ribitol dehydrogenase family and NAD(P)-binding domain-containing protein [Strongyloides ratti]CEF62394.1 Short-chain dehydrogenase/reductase SDR family and Glucose/ribitol dehydrogenase family and NAD(P)-binding domain-containing protein [Strongyloides ratti]
MIRKILETLTINEISEKAILITGCDSGFGKHLALKCIRNGMVVFGTCMTEKGKNELFEEGKKYGSKCFPFIMDVTDDESCSNGLILVKENLKKLNLPGLHGIVANAGITGDPGPFDWMKVEDFKNVFDVNTFGVVRTIQYFIEEVKKVRGRIVLTSSLYGRVALQNLSAYSASKYAIQGLVDSLRREMKPFHVQVMCVEPGVFKTNMTNVETTEKLLKKVYDRQNENVKKQYDKKYLDTLLESMKDLFINKSSDSPDQVSDTYFKCLTSYWPKPRYQVGLDSQFIFAPLSLLPTEIQDYIIKILSFSSIEPKPNVIY